MQHLDFLAKLENSTEEFINKASGRFYTGEPVGRHLAQVAADTYIKDTPSIKSIKVVDPFGGDGRLIDWLLAYWREMNYPSVQWDIHLWDLSDTGFELAHQRIVRAQGLGMDIQFTLKTLDSFKEALKNKDKFDIVITNPPWELLKPDARETQRLSDNEKKRYVLEMREYDKWLSVEYPLSQPKRKFAGWGTNLSRVGCEACLLLVRKEGVVASVLPSSILADDQSLNLRKHLINHNKIVELSYYPAEAKMYGSVDISSITIVLNKSLVTQDFIPLLSPYSKDKNKKSQISLDNKRLENTGYVIPVSFGSKALKLLEKIESAFPKFQDLEGKTLWAGREVDETGSSKWSDKQDSSTPLFLKGRMINRYKIVEKPTLRVGRKNWTPPVSVGFSRIAWRDVSRPSQKRRIIATEIPAGWAAGNSLGVAYFLDGNNTALRNFLAIMSSTVFEFQLRSYLSTGHVSLSSLRKVSIPEQHYFDTDQTLHELVKSALKNYSNVEEKIDAYIAKKLYKLNINEYEVVLRMFDKMSDKEVNAYLNEYRNLTHCIDYIPNHKSARLSELDMKMVMAIPEGGNWKDIPLSIPSKRLEQIRESFKRGEGSRSTYYGRLKNDYPSYTINTYFNRPGNGCHIHYEQNRVISQREAARLQSFPDDFEFVGPQGAVNTQIGNAVPPLLAYQIAKSLGEPGVFIDLFAGAGGLGLGFKWAGWTPLVANDIEPRALATYAKNVHSNTVEGSITDGDVFNELVSYAEKARESNRPFWVLGGPPCQGFSTAGKKRSMNDDRNRLAWDYLRFLECVKPDGFVFENVTGLLSMEKGKVFKDVVNAFASVMPKIDGYVLSADHFGIPQRRKRVFLVGRSDPEAPSWVPPREITSSDSLDLTNRVISVSEAISDLPPLEAGEDGSTYSYICSPKTEYQKFSRGFISPEDYINSLIQKEIGSKNI
ncbi:Alw26I/Eco31I/Esp3I family type II restriction adenine-specific DNA-methyltransferase [Vibrio mimicus]|uniref:Alw26I/Eco31I/Esp3I family type II restriction adenine-specific DNA-methyltransferase n=1 Tax=Vibrio mimicus TaxID=674 RepID=UPI002FF17F9C